MPFNSKTPVQLKVKFIATVETKRKINVAIIYVTADDRGCLLSSNTAQELELVSLNLKKIQVSKMLNSQLSDLAHVPDLDAKEIIRQHQTAFHGIGKLKDKQITLRIEKEVKPIAQQSRRIPFHVREMVELELQQLEKQDIINKVPDTEHTDCISPIVVAPRKDRRIRVCGHESCKHCNKTDTPSHTNRKRYIDGIKWCKVLFETGCHKHTIN